MKPNLNRRKFIRTATVASLGAGIFQNFPLLAKAALPETVRVGIIGLDTSHSVAFVKALNKPDPAPEFAGFRVFAAYPHGSKDIKSSVERIPAYTAEVQKFGVSISTSLPDLLAKVDVVLLETNDGRLHLEQATEVMKAGKPLFIDKPLAASLADAIKIFELSKKYKVPFFSCSSLRYAPGAQAAAAGKAGKVLGADTYSPSKLEKTHPDLFWYGIHAVEILFTVMGTGCKSVSRTHSPAADVCTGTWEGDRIGTCRAIYEGKQAYGGTVFGEKEVMPIGAYGGYDPLLLKIIEFFKTGVPPVAERETLEIYAFMEAADESKKLNGAAVSLESMFARARLNMGRKTGN